MYMIVLGMHYTKQYYYCSGRYKDTFLFHLALLSFTIKYGTLLCLTVTMISKNMLRNNLYEKKRGR